eukprot:1328339-Amorphochlora_amoeboformis.AAC.2
MLHAYDDPYVRKLGQHARFQAVLYARTRSRDHSHQPSYPYRIAQEPTHCAQGPDSSLPFDLSTPRSLHLLSLALPPEPLSTLRKTGAHGCFSGNRKPRKLLFYHGPRDGVPGGVAGVYHDGLNCLSELCGPLDCLLPANHEVALLEVRGKFSERISQKPGRCGNSRERPGLEFTR